MPSIVMLMTSPLYRVNSSPGGGDACAGFDESLKKKGGFVQHSCVKSLWTQRCRARKGAPNYQTDATYTTDGLAFVTQLSTFRVPL